MDKLLSDKAKARRRKLTDINIRVTFIMWAIEFVGSLQLMLITTIFGHEQVGAATAGIFIFAFYFVILPFCYLVNNSDIKYAIVDDGWIRTIRGIFNRTNIQVLPK